MNSTNVIVSKATILILIFTLLGGGCKGDRGPGAETERGTEKKEGSNSKSGIAENKNQVFECPKGTVMRGARPPKGGETWCEKDGVRHGPYADWSYQTGRMNVETNYKDGKEHGRHTEWYSPFGYRTLECSYQDGKLSGAYSEWNTQSRKQHLTLKGDYQADLKNGEWVDFGAGSRINFIGRFEQGVPCGELRCWRENIPVSCELRWNEIVRLGASNSDVVRKSELAASYSNCKHNSRGSSCQPCKQLRGADSSPDSEQPNRPPVHKRVEMQHDGMSVDGYELELMPSHEGLETVFVYFGSLVIVDSNGKELDSTYQMAGYDPPEGSDLTVDEIIEVRYEYSGTAHEVEIWCTAQSLQADEGAVDTFRAVCHGEKGKLKCRKAD